MNKVSCIVPAYNEAKRVGAVLKVATAHPLIAEVVAIDDCSTDGTAQEIAGFGGVHLITCKVNGGKSAAIVEGIRASTGDYLLFLDADLVGLTEADITALIAPVVNGSADATISLRKDALLPWRWLGIDYLSGERVIRRDVLAPHLDTIGKLSGYGLESYINDVTLAQKTRIKIVWWPGVGHTYKVRKYGWIRGVIGEARMLMNIIETISLIGTAHQIILMRRARV